MTWTARTFRRMANAAAELEALHSAAGRQDDPGARELARWAHERRVKLELRAEAEERSEARGQASLSLFEDGAPASTGAPCTGTH